MVQQDPGTILAPINIQGYPAHKKQPPPLGPPYDPRYSPTGGSWEGGVSYDRGTPVLPSGGPVVLTWHDSRGERESALTTFRADESGDREYTPQPQAPRSGTSLGPELLVLLSAVRLIESDYPGVLSPQN
jgi:hypothetical protein